jgi:DNA-binding transcriptional regulator YiaG
MGNVTSGDFTARLLRSAEQAAAIKAGEMEPARVSRRKVTARKTTPKAAPHFDAGRIRHLRERFGVSQPVFAGMIGVKPVTVKGWEQGVNVPSGSSRRVLQMMELSPETAIAAAEVDGIQVSRDTKAQRTTDLCASVSPCEPQSVTGPAPSPPLA